MKELTVWINNYLNIRVCINLICWGWLRADGRRWFSDRRRRVGRVGRRCLPRRPAGSGIGARPPLYATVGASELAPADENHSVGVHLAQPEQ